MTFIISPKKEGETTKCQNCDVDLIGRWTNYKGKWEDKLQWQTLEPRKAHYTKEGECKDSTGDSTNTQHIPGASTVPVNEIEEQLTALNLKVESIYVMIKVLFDKYQERKSQ